MKSGIDDGSYRAFEISGPGSAKITKRLNHSPQETQVRLKVLACSICQGDLDMYGGLGDTLAYPRVPGREIVGLIEAVGSKVVGWRVGQRVGCGFFGGNCGFCPACRRGDSIHCAKLVKIGSSVDGGLAEKVFVDARALVLLPTDLSAAQIAPILGAGVAAFQTLKCGIARAGDVVAIQGLGKVGLLLVQFARKLGLQTVAISSGAAKTAIALGCGAHAYVNSSMQSVAEVLNSVGGAQAIISTVPNLSGCSDLIEGLANRGTLVLMQEGSRENLRVPAAGLYNGSKTVRTVRFGTPWDMEDTLRFSITNRITSQAEVVLFDKLPEVFKLASSARNNVGYVTELGT